jgi:hypothetical protein
MEVEPTDAQKIDHPASTKLRVKPAMTDDKQEEHDDTMDISLTGLQMEQDDGIMSQEELIAKLAEIELLYKKEKRKNARALLASKKPEVKVSTKGCVQINGIRRFPITLYKNEWEIIFGMVPELKTFIAENDNQLASLD